MARCLAAVLLFSVTARAALGESAVGKIRAAIQLPRVDVSVYMVFVTTHDIGSDGDPVDAEAEIAELRGRIRGRVSDATALVLIAERTAAIGDRPRTEEANRVAMEAARRWRDAEPGNPAAVVAMSRALRASDRMADAEAQLRSAGSSPAAVIHRELGNLLLSRAMNRTGTNVVLLQMGQGIRDPGIRAELGIALGEMERSVEAFTAAIRLEPDTASLRLDRARAVAWRSMMRQGLEKRREDEPLVPPMLTMFSAEAVEDLEAALRLSPEDPEILAVVAGARATHWIGDAIRDPRRLPELLEGDVPRIMRLMSGEDRRVVLGLMDRLERVAETAVASKKARAWEALAKLKFFVMGDVASAKEMAMRVLRMDARHQEAFHVIVWSIVTAQGGGRDLEMLEEAVRLRMRVSQDERTRMILVKTLDMRGKTDEAVRVALDAQKAFPGNPAFTEAALAVRLRRGDRLDSAADSAWLAGFRERMDGAWRSGPSSPAALHEMVTFGLGVALLGDVQQARSMIRRLVAAAPGDSYVREADTVLREALRESN